MNLSRKWLSEFVRVDVGDKLKFENYEFTQV